MSVPTEIDWVLVKLGNGADPEVFTMICGIQDVSINQTANTSDRFVRDCTTPGRVPTRAVKVNGMQLDVTGSGLSNANEIVRLKAALGKKKNYEIEAYAANDTDAGELLGTYTGNFVMTANNLSTSLEGDASGEITLASNGDWTYEAA